MKLRREFERDGKTVAVQAERIEGDRWRVRIGERTLELTALPVGDGGLRLVLHQDEEARSHLAFGAAADKQFMVRIDGTTYTLSPPAGRGPGAGSATDGTVRAPMTGTVLAVHCNEGEAVEADDVLVVLSAMKMEHKLTSGVAGTVRKVATEAGATVDQGDELISVEPVSSEG